MCRWAAYRGDAIFMDRVVTRPAHSLIAQSQCASKAKTATNGDGFGVAWYGEHAEPGLYRDILPAWSDCNLLSLTRQVRSPLFLAHVRAATAGATSRDNCHPFVAGRWSFMHNGQLNHFERLRRPLEALLDDALYAKRRGQTDSELLFLLALQFGLDTDPLAALRMVIERACAVAASRDVPFSMRFTAALSDGDRLIAIRHATDDRAPTLFHAELASGHCLVSEPFEDDTAVFGAVEANRAIVIDDHGIETLAFEPNIAAACTAA